MECLICTSEKLTVLTKYTDAPSNIQRLLTKEQLSQDNKISFDLVKCDSCGLIQLGDLSNISEDYYDEYYMTTSFSSQLTEYVDWLSDKFISTFNLSGKKLFEIGCGDGQFLKLFDEKNVITKGFEPSKVFFDEAKKKNLDVINDYFTSKVVKKDEFDAFVSRAVFEHLKNPNEILRDIFFALKDGGVGLIEVPSFEKAIKQRRYYDVFTDHVAYYTKQSLGMLLERNGFELVESFNSFNDEFIVAFFRKNISYSLPHFIKDFENYIKTFQKDFIKLQQDYSSIAMWGAGAKGNALLSMAGFTDKDIDYVIDSDPFKIGKYTIGSHIPIVSPELLLEKKPDVIILTALAYADEIVSLIKNKYNFKGRIFTISPELKEVQ